MWLLVVTNPHRWKMDIPEVEVVSARDYLSSPAYAERKRVRVLNLCRSYAYQSSGYYVSLLAEARGHRPMPNVGTLQDFKAPSIIRALAVELEPLIERALASLQSDKFTLSIYFGRNLAKRYEALSRQLYNLFPSPMLRAQFVKDDGEWRLENISPIAASEIPETHREFAYEAARDFLSRRVPSTKGRTVSRYDLAMLVDETEALPPSNEAALKRFIKAGARMGIRVEEIDRDDYGHLAEFDGLFIRVTTSVNHYTYRFARRAEAEGMAVFDDPRSILRCSNKVFLQEMLGRHGVPGPRTYILHKENAPTVLRALGLPIILKQPDSSFSQGVIKVTTEEDFHATVARLLEGSELLIAQEFLQTPFDWRIGVIDGEPFYACQYHMARGHWQIYNHSAARIGNRTGNANAVPLADVPAAIVDNARRAAALMGDGLYGVDVKEIDDRAYVIEVNDNPSIDAGIEDAVIGDALYDRVMQSFLRRMEARRRA